MSASNAFETSLLQHIFQNANIAGIGDAGGLRGSVVAGVLYVSLHTADPGEAGNKTTNEATYTSYARLSVARDGSNWTVAGNNASNTLLLTFPQCTGGSNTITHFGIGTDAAGVGNLLFSGALAASIIVSNLITPKCAVGDLDINDD